MQFLRSSTFQMVALSATLAAQFSPAAFGQGSLTPPGAPAPTMKTLEQVEPRRPISSLPFTINAPGSYYVTTNLSATSGNGIVIDASSVTLDLNGFRISGSAASSNGITVLGSQTNISVRNGVVANWGFIGVDTSGARGGQLADLRVTGCGYIGLAGGPGNNIVRCVASANQGIGMHADRGSTFENCLAEGNGNTGIGFANGGVTINNCTATGNTNYGFFSGSHGVIASCAAKENGESGFFGGRGTQFVNCHSSENGVHGFEVGFGGSVINCTAADNFANGITASYRCLVKGNNAYANAGSGIRITDSGNRVEGNNVSENAYGVRTDFGGNLIIQNSAFGNTSGNFPITGTQTIGPIISATGTITTNNSWANFAF